MSTPDTQRTPEPAPSTPEPLALKSNAVLGPNVQMPEPIGGVMPEDGTEYVDCYSAAQMYDYAMACVVAATTECSQHWQAKVTGLEQAAGLLAMDRAELRKALRALLYDDDHDAAKNAARAALADLGA